VAQFSEKAFYKCLRNVWTKVVIPGQKLKFTCISVNLFLSDEFFFAVPL
jgi:hypothetical protein